MKNKPNLFPEIEKECKYKTYQDKKCVNEKNKNFRLISSCQKEFCPLMGNDLSNKGCIELSSKVIILKLKS